MKDLEKMLMSKKGKSEMSEQEMQAKMDVLKELLQMAQSAMGSKVKGGLDEMKKVSVMAPDAQGLEKGLELAQELTPAIESGEIDSSTEMSQEDDSEMKEKLEAMTSEEEPEEESMFAKKEKALEEKPKKKSFFGMDDED